MRLTLCLLLVGFWGLMGCESREEKLKREAGVLIAEVEAFQQKHARLPENVTELGREDKMEGPVYYQKNSDSSFWVSYGMAVGESMIYRSETGKWQDH
jgi:hypothetical protein